MLAGDAVAGEANRARCAICSPCRSARTRLLASSTPASSSARSSRRCWSPSSGLLVGLVLFGGGDVTLLSGHADRPRRGVLRLLGVCPYLGVCLAALGAVGLFVSTLTEQPMGPPSR